VFRLGKLILTFKAIAGNEETYNYPYHKQTTRY
jgi:hypothetical protein